MMRFNAFIWAILSLVFVLPAMATDTVVNEKNTTLKNSTLSHDPVLKQYRKFDHGNVQSHDHAKGEHEMQHDHANHEQHQHTGHHEPVEQAPSSHQHSHGE